MGVDGIRAYTCICVSSSYFNPLPFSLSTVRSHKNTYKQWSYQHPRNKAIRNSFLWRVPVIGPFFWLGISGIGHQVPFWLNVKVIWQDKLAHVHMLTGGRQKPGRLADKFKTGEIPAPPSLPSVIFRTYQSLLVEARWPPYLFYGAWACMNMRPQGTRITFLFPWTQFFFL